MPQSKRNHLLFGMALLAAGLLAVPVPGLAEYRLVADPEAAPYRVVTRKWGGTWRDSEGVSRVMADIDGDGNPELVEGFTNRFLGLEAEDGKIKNRWQINLAPGWFLTERDLLGVPADLDHDGIDEIYTSIHNRETDAWRFAVLSPARRAVLFTAPLPKAREHRPDGHWDGDYWPELLLPNADGRGRTAILFAREVQYDAYGRGLVAVDPFTGQVIWEWSCGPNPSPGSVKPVDLGDGRRGIAFFGNGPENLGGEEVNGTSDDRGYAFLVSETGELVWQKAFTPGFTRGDLQVADIGGDGRQDLVIATSSNGTNVPNELTIWDWREDRPLATFRSQAWMEGVAIIDGPRPGTNWIITGSDQGMVIRYLYADGTLTQDARVLSPGRTCSLAGVVDILPAPGPEILLNSNDTAGFFLVDRDLNTLAYDHDLSHPGGRMSPMVWPLEANRKALIAGTNLGYWIMEFPRRPFDWGRWLVRIALALGGVGLLWGVFALGRRRGSRLQAEAALGRHTDREALFRLWQDLDDVKHERLFEPSKGFRRLVWLMDAFVSDLGTADGLAERIVDLLTDFRSSDLPRLRSILARAAAEQVAPEAVDTTAMVLAAAVGKLDALAEAPLTVSRVRAVHQDLAADLQKVEDGFLEIWRTLGEFYTTDPARLIQGLLLVRDVETRRAGITVASGSIDPDPAFLCRIDSSDLRYVLGNLLDNAVRALAAAEEKVITLGLERQDLEVVITVADTGPGISAENRGRIFSGRYSSRGGGQGLFRSREILRRWRGEIRLLDPESGTGAVFTVTLPAAVKDLAAAG